MCSCGGRRLLCDELSDLVGGLDPDAVALCDATALWKTFDAIERLGAAGKTLLARKVDDAGAWKASGYKSAAEAMAATSGTSITAAKQVIETSRRVAELPATAEALRSGVLSPQKAEAIAAAATVVPEREQELLAGRECDVAGSARRVPEGEGRRGRRRDVPAHPRGSTPSRVRRQRRRVEPHRRGTPDRGAEVRRTLDEIGEELFKLAYKNGTREAREAYAFDALVEMARRARGEQARRRPRSRRRSISGSSAPTSKLSNAATSPATSCARSPASAPSPCGGPKNCSASRC